MRVLVTGGAGYVGSIVTEALVDAGHQAVVYDNLSRGHRDAVVEAATLVVADLLDGEALRGTLRGRGIEAVVHLAALSEVGASAVDPAAYYRNNVVAGLGLLDAMREAGVDLLIFSSSAAVYGDPERSPIREADRTAPVSPYGATKLAFEQALDAYEGAYGLRASSLRFFNAAGATARNGERHVPETHLVPRLLQVAAGRLPELVVHGGDYPTRDGTCLRDYVDVEDLARVHVLALEALAGGVRLGRRLNVGSGRGHTVLEVVEAVRRATGRPVPVRMGPRRAGDPAALVASGEALDRELGWRPGRSLTETVESAWRWLRARR